MLDANRPHVHEEPAQAPPLGQVPECERRAGASAREEDTAMADGGVCRPHRAQARVSRGRGAAVRVPLRTRCECRRLMGVRCARRRREEAERRVVPAGMTLMSEEERIATLTALEGRLRAVEVRRPRRSRRAALTRLAARAQTHTGRDWSAAPACGDNLARAAEGAAGSQIARA